MTTLASEWPTIAQAARAIRARSLSPVELTEALLRRIERFDGGIRAFNTLVPEHALATAREAEREIAGGHHRGVLHGIPIGLKDVYDTAGILTSAYSRAYLHNVPARDAVAFARLRKGGAILLGKLATHELANGGPSFDLPWPPARNPWNTRHFTGGSSTGAGAAIAAGFVLGALGTDTGGSIRIPAALCGVAGLKPTYGRVSRAGVMPHSYSFDHCGPLAWTVEDCALLLQAIAGHDPMDPASADRPVVDYCGALGRGIRGLRIGVLRQQWEDDLAAPAEVCVAMDAAIEVLAGLGARIEPARLPSVQCYYDVKTVISKPEVLAVHARRLIEGLDDFGADFLALTLGGCLYSGLDCERARQEQRRLAHAAGELFGRYDLLVTAASGPAPLLAATNAGRAVDHWRKPNFETVFSVTGGPVLTLCIGFTADGLPLAMQIAGRHFDEAAVLAAGHAYEAATSWRARRPLLQPGTAPIEPPRTTGVVVPGAADAALRDHVRMMARHAGLMLAPDRLAQLTGIAPYALAAARRIEARIAN